MLNNITLFIVLIILGISTITQLVYYWFIYSKVAFFNPENEYTREDEPVSIIICARNEYYNLSKNLPLILDQDYSSFEVVVINHGSDDDTAYLLRDFSERHKNLKVVNVPEDLNFFTGKKFPLSIGIKSASNDILLFTDADCYPLSNLWLRNMASNFVPKTEIVLGYGAYDVEPSMVNKLIHFDTMRVAMNYLSFALIGMPYMGVGRNMAYRKSLFYKQNGFISHYHIKSGDDDLFVNKAATKNNTRIEIRSGAYTISEPKKTLSQWIRQKRRHLLTGVEYKAKHKFALSLFGATQVIFWITALFLGIMLYQPFVVGGLFLARLLSQLIVCKKVMQKLSEKGFLLLIPIFEVFIIVVTPVLSILNVFNPIKKWK